MQRVSTTMIGLVGDHARACAQALQRAPNIRVELPDPTPWAPTRRPWYLGVLARSAPARVVPDRV